MDSPLKGEGGKGLSQEIKNFFRVFFSFLDFFFVAVILTIKLRGGPL